MTAPRGRRPVTFTLDVEDHRARPGDPDGHVALTRAIIEFLGERGIAGTFFVVGDVAEEFPDLVQEIAAAGHEVAMHSFSHIALPDLTPDAFAAGARDAKKLLEDLAQQPIVGFRAPIFSLVAGSRWAVDVLGELGFAYSSSVMPIHHPLYGDPGHPTTPFHWENGLVELPCPVLRCSPSYGLPVLGAVWLRNLPSVVARAGLAQAPADAVLWTYAHPYDFDPDEPFRVLPEAGQVGSRLLWRRRDRMYDCFDRLLHGRVAPPLRERAARLPALPALPEPSPGR